MNEDLIEVLIGPHYGVGVPGRKGLYRLIWWGKRPREIGYVELGLMLLREPAPDPRGAAAAIAQLKLHDSASCERCRSFGYDKKIPAAIARSGR
jgi:hypothetical protein